MDENEMKFDRKQFYAAVCIDLTAAFNGLPDYDFRTMAASVREYLRRLEKELDKCEKVFPVEPISYLDCSNAMLKMWMDNVVTDGEYNRIMDKLNKKHEETLEGGVKYKDVKVIRR